MRKGTSPLHKLSNLKKTLGLVWKASPGWTIAGGALLFLQGIVPLAALYLLKLIVDAVTTALADGGATGFGKIGVLIGIAAAVSLLTVFLNSISNLVSEAQSQQVSDYVMGLLHQKSLEADLEYYETPEYYDTLHMAQEEAAHRPLAVVSSLFLFGRNALSLAAVAVLLFSFHWLVAVILLAAVVPGILVRFRYGRKMYEWHTTHMPKIRRAEYYNRLLTGYDYAKEVRLFGLGPLLGQRYGELRKILRRARIELAKSRMTRELLMQIPAAAAVFGSLAFIAYRALNGFYSVGDLVMYFAAFQRGQVFFRELLSALADVYENGLFVSNFYDFLNLEPKVREPDHPRSFPSPLKAGITAEEIVFAYPGIRKPVLDGVSFSIQPGEHVALVGENGAGKTTLVKLLCRLYDPQAGSLQMDGIGVKEFSVSDLRSRVGIIFQDYIRYHLSVRDNIRFGNISVPDSDEKIKEAARRSGADAVIQKLPRGYDTVLGKMFEEGEELSLGEWQKIALARAFLRDAEILILDEPTSSLDPRSEAQVFETFHKLANNRTTIIISHRMSTVRTADRILVLDEGRIVEDGTHEGLMSSGGLYSKLFDLQARHYT